MKNRDKWRGLRSQDVKVYPCRVLVANGQPIEQVIDAPKAATMSKNNQRRVKEILCLRKRTRRS
jgi:hypothetical protein